MLQKKLLILLLIISSHISAARITIHTSDRELFAEQSDLEKSDYFRALFSSGMIETETLELDWRSEYGPAVEIILDFIKYGVIRSTDEQTYAISIKIADKICLDSFKKEKRAFIIHQPMFELKHSGHLLAGFCVLCSQPLSSLSFYLHYQVKHALNHDTQELDPFSTAQNGSEFYTPNSYISFTKRKLARVIPLKLDLSDEQAQHAESQLLAYTHDEDD